MLLQAVPARLGRFKIIRLLGRGAQGAVYLAEDTQLGRQVAIKTLELRAPQCGPTVAALLDEARIVGQLAHPHIVPLYDVGEQDGQPWLVFEYVEGATLDALIRQSGVLPADRALELIIQILKATGFAHARGIVHRDLKPANVMVAADGNARVMDFGIARLVGNGSGDEPLAGTPAYLAPECIAGAPFSASSDLFALGMLLYEMLTGAPAVSGANAFETMHRLMSEPVVPPSARNPALGERVDDLVLKAIAKDPATRFASAAAMENAVYLVLNPEPTGGDSERAEAGSGTLAFLLRRMRHRSDFPALSATIAAVNRAASSDTERVAQLSNAVLKDFALTNKLLKQVNSALYGQYGGTISTVSRAVVIMGFETIRQIAVTLLLFEHLQNKAHAAQLKDEVIAAYFTGLIARQLAAAAGVRDAEEGFICAAFHRLGKLLTAFYFHDEFLEIERRGRQHGLDEERAAAAVLGLSYEELGVGVARAWHFPQRLTDTLRRLPDQRAARPAGEEERLRLLAGLASGLASAARQADPGRRRAAIAAVAANYADALGLSPAQLSETTQRAAAELVSEAGLLSFKPSQSPLYCALAEWTRDAAAPAAPAPDALGSLITATGLDEARIAAAVDAPATPPEQAQAVLAAGIQDITNTLVGEFELNDVLRMILETMYRAMGFTRVLLAIRDPAANALRGRFGFGADVDRILRRGFSVSLAPARDVFHAAISQGADIYLEDIDADNIRAHVPEWFRKLIPARALMLFPVKLGKTPIGLLYADCDQPGALRMGAGELRLLKTLRNQAILALRQKS